MAYAFNDDKSKVEVYDKTETHSKTEVDNTFIKQIDVSKAFKRKEVRVRVSMEPVALSLSESAVDVGTDDVIVNFTSVYPLNADTDSVKYQDFRSYGYKLYINDALYGRFYCRDSLYLQLKKTDILKFDVTDPSVPQPSQMQIYVTVFPCK